MLEKESNIRRKSLKERFLRYGNFRCLSSFGIIDYLYERLSLDMGYRICLWNSSHRVFFYKRNTYYKR
jgi:hypothetical protein